MPHYIKSSDLFTITDIWTVYDVENRCRDRFNDPTLTVPIDICERVLRLMKKHYDANVGYNYSEVDYWYDQVMKNK